MRFVGIRSPRKFRHCFRQTRSQDCVSSLRMDCIIGDSANAVIAMSPKVIVLACVAPCRALVARLAHVESVCLSLGDAPRVGRVNTASETRIGRALGPLGRVRKTGGRLVQQVSTQRPCCVNCATVGMSSVVATTRGAIAAVRTARSLVGRTVAHSSRVGIRTFLGCSLARGWLLAARLLQYGSCVTCSQKMTRRAREHLHMMNSRPTEN